MDSVAILSAYSQGGRVEQDRLRARVTAAPIPAKTAIFLEAEMQIDYRFEFPVTASIAIGPTR